MVPEELQELQKRIKIFVAETDFEGCDGLKINEEMKVTVAAQACLMIIGVDNFYFDNVRTVLMFPASFDRKTNDGVSHGTQARLGEAWQGGPIVLSWRDTLSGGRNEDDGKNLVIHEFAHALDGLDGEMGGQVVFDDPNRMRQWREVVEREFAELFAAKYDGRSTVLDHYGATNQAEFFAVACESFFEEPDKLRAEHSDLFELLEIYFGFDPQRWQRQNRRRSR